MGWSVFDLDKYRRRRRRRKYTDRAPQKQCRDKAPHVGHHFDRGDGLINWCQGRR